MGESESADFYAAVRDGYEAARRVRLGEEGYREYQARQTAEAECERLRELCSAYSDDAHRLTMELDRLRAGNDALVRECDRLRHGREIESDFVCYNAPELEDARKRIADLEREVARLKLEAER